MLGVSSATTKYLLNTITASASDEGLPSCVISTINPDRDADRVIPEGMDASNFLKAPTLMWSHGGPNRYASLPIGTVTSLSVTPGQDIKATWRWLENDPFADRVKNAWNQGAVRGTSIGFRPIKSAPNGKGVDFETWELLELSICPIPANPEAVRTLKSLGLMDEPTLLYGPDGVPLQTSPAPDVVKTEPVEVEKSGRVLSAVNESRLRAAVTALSDATSVLSEVLAQVMRPAQEEPEKPVEDEPMEPPADLEPAKPEDEAVTFLFDDEPTVLRLTMDESEDEAVCTIVDDKGREAMFLIDPSVMKSVIADTIREHLQHSLVEPVGEMVQQALDTARGRVH
jgi:HK97 family phage prohead protease